MCGPSLSLPVRVDEQLTENMSTHRREPFSETDDYYPGSEANGWHSGAEAVPSSPSLVREQSGLHSETLPQKGGEGRE